VIFFLFFDENFYEGRYDKRQDDPYDVFTELSFSFMNALHVTAVSHSTCVAFHRDLRGFTGTRDVSPDTGGVTRTLHYTHHSSPFPAILSTSISK
jgi:hypothetical protein